LPESYLLLFFSLTFFLHPCGVQPFEILREIAVNIYRVLRVDSPTHYRFDIRIFRSVKSNVNKPAPCSTICHLARKCRIAGSCHQDARSVQLPGRLIAQRNKVQIFRVDLLEPGVAKKTDRERKLKGLGRRPPSGRQVPQVASCESRAWRSGSAIIPVGGLPNAMALIVRRCQPSGPSRSPKIYRFTVYRFAVVEKPLVI
jgi:hypothetical protein